LISGRLEFSMFSWRFLTCGPPHELMSVSRHGAQSSWIAWWHFHSQQASFSSPLILAVVFCDISTGGGRRLNARSESALALALRRLIKVTPRTLKAVLVMKL
jgi:hypothetical protein